MRVESTKDEQNEYQRQVSLLHVLVSCVWSGVHLTMKRLPALVLDCLVAGRAVAVRNRSYLNVSDPAAWRCRLRATRGHRQAPSPRVHRSASKADNASRFLVAALRLSRRAVNKRGAG